MESLPDRAGMLQILAGQGDPEGIEQQHPTMNQYGGRNIVIVQREGETSDFP